jgi:hypothetical protein
MTCGERWGVGTSVFGARAEKHKLMGHTVMVGDDQNLERESVQWGTPLATMLVEPMPVYRCLDCEEIWVLGTPDAYDRAVEHKGMGHRVFQGDEADMKKLTLSKMIDLGPQTPNPLDPNSVTGGGTILTLTGGE